MDQLHEPKSEALRALYWRDEILQLLFWIEGEGLGDRLDPDLLERFLGVRTSVASHYLGRLADEGMLQLAPDSRYQLTGKGREYGARVFAREFADLTQPAHGECGPDCWCHASPEEAETCLEQRTGAVPPDREH